jgi:hypothetical protein
MSWPQFWQLEEPWMVIVLGLVFAGVAIAIVFTIAHFSDKEGKS